MKARPQKGPSQRQLRAGELLRHALAEILTAEDIDDPDLEGQILTVVEVRVSPDLKNATVFVNAMAFGGNDRVAGALNRHQRFLRGALARRIDLKYVPDLAFRADHAVEAVQRIEDLLRSPEVARDLK